MLAQLGKTAALIALIAAPAAASAGGYQASGYESQFYSASTRVEEGTHEVTGVFAGDGRAHITGSYQGGHATGGDYQNANQDDYGHGADFGPTPVARPGCAPAATGERVLRCVYVPRPLEVRLNDGFFAGGGGVGPDYIAGGSGGGGGLVVIGGGMASAGARAAAYASASTRASARVSVSGRTRGYGRKGGCGCR